LHEAVKRAAADGCDSLQVFTKSPRSWREPPLPDAARIRAFCEARAEHRIGPVLAHASYLINPSAADPAVRRKGRGALVAEARRCDALGIEFLVLHPGSAGGGAVDDALALAGGCLRHVLDRSDHVTLLVENTAGQGSALGHAFEHLAQVIDHAGADERLGVCFDTCHAFAAGYDLSSARATRRTIGELEAAVGSDRLKALHLNDCRSGLGSRVDRHELIGRGEIGEEAFRWIVRQRRFDGLPAVVETPIPRGETYRKEVARLRALARG
jgi:deoxyribonuclease-4